MTYTWLRSENLLLAVCAFSAKSTPRMDTTIVGRHVLAYALMAAALAHEYTHVCSSSRNRIITCCCLICYRVSKRLKLGCKIEAFLSNQSGVDLLVLQS